MNYFISAGEVSGDMHAAPLIKALKSLDERAAFTFLGGDCMAAEAATHPLIHISAMNYMGFSEVLRHLGDVRANLRTARSALRATHPDALVLVDYPSFNLRLAREARALGIPVFYYIPPKVWAWKEWRVKALRSLCRHILCIFPFEKEFYARHGMNVTYVGNPSRAAIDGLLPALPPPPQQGEGILALVPGSRNGEIRCNLPVMVSAARAFPALEPVIAAAPGVDPALYATLAPGVRVHPAGSPPTAGSHSLMRSAVAALVTSGTATLECALLGTPQVACYRANGSRLSHAIMKRLLNVDKVTLPNLIAGSFIIPEMLLHRCTPELVARELAAILPGEPGRLKMLEGYAHMRSLLGSGSAPQEAARSIMAHLRH